MNESVEVLTYLLHLDVIVITKAFDQRGIIFFLSKNLKWHKVQELLLSLQACLKFHRPITILYVFSRGKKKKEQCIGDYIVAPLTPKISSSRNFSSFTQFSFFPCFSPIGRGEGRKIDRERVFLCCRKGKIDFEKNMGGSNKRTLFN